VELTRALAEALLAAGGRATLVLASTTRAGEPTEYGRTKLEAERLVRAYGERSGATVAVDRLPNVFGKWSRPFYNSAVATFCHSIARDLPVEVHDERRTVRLLYGEDAAQHLVGQALGRVAPDAEPGPVHERTLGEIVALLRQFRALRTELQLPDFSDDFVRKLYTTYVSFLPTGDAAYALTQHTDERGALAELLKSPWFGQVFVSRTKPGVTRGNHFHQTKTEKFVVVEGDAVIRLRPSEGGEVTEIPVRGSELRVVDIPPGYTHNITNVGAGDLVTLFWSSEVFDRARPDTYPMQV
jgi:UDP-2-acetamido-2,6-beta-L-arabino-hexul-4-ose reductase